MAQVLTKTKKGGGLGLTSNPFVDNGLAVIAALCDCERIEDLTLAKVRSMHRKGEELASANTRLSGANYMVFVNSYTQ